MVLVYEKQKLRFRETLKSQIPKRPKKKNIAWQLPFSVQMQLALPSPRDFPMGGKSPTGKKGDQVCQGWENRKDKGKKETHSRELEDGQIITEKISLVNNWIY